MVMSIAPPSIPRSMSSPNSLDLRPCWSPLILLWVRRWRWRHSRLCSSAPLVRIWGRMGGLRRECRWRGNRGRRVGEMRRGRLPLQRLRIYSDCFDFVQDLVQRLAVQSRLGQHLVLERLAVLALAVVEAGRRGAPRLFARVVYVCGDAPAVFDPLDLARQELGFAAHDVRGRRVVVVASAVR
jgi:hypothetical protein